MKKIKRECNIVNGRKKRKFGNNAQLGYAMPPSPSLSVSVTTAKAYFRLSLQMDHRRSLHYLLSDYSSLLY